MKKLESNFKTGSIEGFARDPRAALLLLILAFGAPSIACVAGSSATSNQPAQGAPTVEHEYTAAKTVAAQKTMQYKGTPVPTSRIPTSPRIAPPKRK